MSAKIKIALIINEDFSMWHFRRGLLSALVKKGFDVYVITPTGPYVEKMESLGLTHIAIPMERFIGPLADLFLFIRLFFLFRKHRFDIVHTMTVKPNVFGVIAAKLAGIKKVVGLVSGTGFVFSETVNLRQKVLRALVCRLYRFANRFTTRVWFQNGEDLDIFVAHKLISRNKTLLIKSGGINIDEYSFETVSEDSLHKLREELNVKASSVVIMLISARMIVSKGIKEFLEASKVLADKYPQAIFVLVGPLEPHSPEAIPQDVLESYDAPNVRLILTFRSDVKELVAVSDVMTLPSYYREGVPRVLLEALALNKPIVTTDNVGCREVVDDGKNGFIVPIKNHIALADAFSKLISDESLRREYGNYSRRRAENEFSEKEVVRRIITELYGVKE
ncbi:glycosyltransferase family 4 protein [bacterium]|nr:glycosyltransferase family 4 protein [bacterium]